MTTLYLHIGTPKTGTTHLQKFFWNNAAALEKQGYVYPHFKKFPDIGHPRNGAFIKQSFKLKKNQLIFLSEYEELYSSNIHALNDLAAQYSNIILSDEGLWNSNNGYLKYFVDTMKSDAIQIKVIVYLRVQDLYIQSLWAQKVKERFPKTFQEYLSIGGVDFTRFYYSKRLDEVAQLVGKENMIVRVYEKSQFINQDLTDDFFQSIGLTLTTDFILPEKESNPSIGGPYLETKRLLNSNKEFAAFGNYITPLLITAMENDQFRADFKTSHYFTLKERDAFMRQYEESNAYVAKEYLGREDGKLFYEEPGTSNDWVGSSYSSQELVNICGQMLSIQRAEFMEKEENYKNIIKEQKETIKELKKSFTYRLIRKLKHIFKI